MSLQVWLPLTKDTRQQGLNSAVIEEVTSTVFDNSGKLGKCLSGGKIKIPASQVASIFNNTAMSIAFWYNNNTSETTGNHAICGFSGNGEGDTDAVRIWDFFNYANPNTFHWSMGTLGGGSLANIFPANTWVHVCVTWNAPTLKIYMDGVLKYTGSGSSNYTFDKSYYISFGHTPQKLNDFRIYDHCLSPMEVKELSKGLVLHYPLNRGGWGQENLYTGSRDFSGTWVNGSAWTTSAETYEGFTVKQKSTVWGGLAQNITCSNGDVFTVSFYAKVTSGGNILSIHRSSLGNVTTGLTILGGNFSSSTNWVNTGEDGTQWKRYWATVRIDSSDITYLQWRIENSVADKTLYVCGMKLEKGSIATPWCPNSSDTLATAVGLNGTTEYDCSGYCNNGTRTGTLEWTSDTSKYAVSTNFAAVGTVTNNTSPIHLSNDFTIAWWGKVNSWKKSWEGMFLLQNNATLNAGLNTYDIMSAIHASTANSMSLTICQNGSSYAFDKYKWTYTIGTWAHYTCTYKAGAISIYQNGVLVYTETITDNSSNDYYCRLGYRAGACDCQMSDFRIYATALSADDVKSLYQNCATIDPDGTIRGQIRS